MTGLWQSPEFQRLGWTLLHSLWQGALLFALAAVLLRAMRNSSPQARYLVACCALGAMLVLAVGTYAYLANQMLPAPAQAAASAPMAPVLSGLSGLPAASIAGAAATVDAWYMPIVPIVQWLPIGWMAGVMLFSLRLLGGWYWLIFGVKAKAGPAPSEWQWHLDGLSRIMGAARRASLLVSPKIMSPLVMGWIKPVVLIPASALLHLTPQALEAALAHELAHIRRHDYLVNFLQSIVEALFFYHPAAWWLSGQMRELREHCCDDAAAKHCGGPIPYATALADLETLRAGDALPKLAPAAKGASLMKRVQRLLGVSMPVASGIRTGLLAAAILSMIGATALWGFAEDSQQKQRITIKEGNAALNIQMLGDVKLDKNSKDGVALGEGAVLEISAKDGAATRHITVRRERDGIKKTYRENGIEKPLDTEAETWMNSQIKEIEAVEIHKAGLAASGNDKISFEILKNGQDGSVPKIIVYSNKDSAGRNMFDGGPFNLRLDFPGTAFLDGGTFHSKDIEMLQGELEELHARLQTNSGAKIFLDKELDKDIEILQGQFGDIIARLQTKGEAPTKSDAYEHFAKIQANYEEYRAKMQADPSNAKKWSDEYSAKSRAATEELRAKARANAEAARKQLAENRARMDARAKVILKEIEENRTKVAEAAQKQAEALQKRSEETRADARAYAEEANVKARAHLEAIVKRMEEDYAKAKREGSLDPKELIELEKTVKRLREAVFSKKELKKRAEADSPSVDTEKLREQPEEVIARNKANAEAAQKRLNELGSRSEAFKKPLNEAIAKAKAEGRKMSQEDLEKSLREQGVFESINIPYVPKVGIFTGADGEQWRELGRYIFHSKANSEAAKKALEEVRAKAKADGRAMDIKDLERRLKELGLSSDAVILVDRDKNNLLPDNATFYLLY